MYIVWGDAVHIIMRRRTDSQIIRGMMADMKQLQCCAAHLRLCLPVFLTIGKLRADRAV